MNESLKDTTSRQKAEILQMTIKIINRYDVLNYNLAIKVATTLYHNGIGIDKFQPKYYKGTFHLDEIIIYLLEKQIREEKTIDYTEYVEHKKEQHKSTTPIIWNPSEKISKMMPYKYRPKTKRRINPLYYYNKNIK